MPLKHDTAFRDPRNAVSNALKRRLASGRTPSSVLLYDNY